MSPIKCIADLAGLDLTKEGWGIAFVYRVYYTVGSAIRVVGYYREEHIADAVIADYQFGSRLTKEPRLALVNLTKGFELEGGNKFLLADKKMLQCAQKKSVIDVPAQRSCVEDDFVPRHPYHRPDESEGPDPSTHPSWNN